MFSKSIAHKNVDNFQNRLCVYWAWVEGNGVKMNCVRAMMESFTKYCIIWDKQELAGFQIWMWVEEIKKVMKMEKPPTTSGSKSKVGDWEKLGNENPKRLYLNKHISPEKKITQVNTDLPESFPSVYLKLSKIKGKRKIRLTNQINKADLRIMCPENFV